QAVAAAGAPALATGSSPLAAAQGYPDGEVIPLARLLETVSQIVGAVDVPVSVDFESGYAGSDLQKLAENIDRLLDTGAVGINFEDQRIGEGGVYTIEEQAERIATVRRVAENRQMGLFINARTDLFLQVTDESQHAGLLPEAIRRAQAYQEAGSSGFFAVGLYAPMLITELCQAVDLPVNVLHGPKAVSHTELAACGAARISHGPFVYRALMQQLQDMVKR
ncbi:MAG TPA: isocitrate lyase/phosphoenolpyruvate mutase family protein, partial [Cytophagales bacterium]|nr:isocitrate lyase/phosphoenolpyruvate mutase family protein [Cytophagales bacterium]